MRNGYPIAVIKNDDRDEYMKAVETASTSGNLNDFVDIVVNAVDKSLDTYLYIVQ